MVHFVIVEHDKDTGVQRNTNLQALFIQHAWAMASRMNKMFENKAYTIQAYRYE